MDVIEDLEKKFGRSLTAKDLARLLRVDPRTVNQYAHLWGGIKVTPTHYRFFEKKVVEVLQNANNHNEKGQTPLSGKGYGAKKSVLKTFPERRNSIQTGCNRMGNRDKKISGKRVDGHELFVDRCMDE
jgi:hypothetical protein